jgi:Nose resistant-to-fluoxetine protein, N-terminal domain
MNRPTIAICLILLLEVSVNEAIFPDVPSLFPSSSAKAKIPKDDALCEKQISLLVDGFARKEIWALKVFDSFGKSQAGLFSGNLVNFGHYDQCLGTRHRFTNKSDGVYQGQHCMIFFREGNGTKNSSLNVQDLILPQVIHIELIRQYTTAYKVKIGTALCVPSVCTSSMVRTIADGMLAVNGMATTMDYNQEQFCNTNNILEMRSIDMLAA